MELVPGSRGIFEVAVDGRVVAKKAQGVFPSPEDCATAVRNAVVA